MKKRNDKMWFKVYKATIMLICSIAAIFFIMVGGTICIDQLRNFQEWVSLLLIFLGAFMVLVGIGFALVDAVLWKVKYE